MLVPPTRRVEPRLGADVWCGAVFCSSLRRGCPRTQGPGYYKKKPKEKKPKAAAPKTEHGWGQRVMVAMALNDPAELREAASSITRDQLEANINLKARRARGCESIHRARGGVGVGAGVGVGVVVGVAPALVSSWDRRVWAWGVGVWCPRSSPRGAVVGVALCAAAALVVYWVVYTGHPPPGKEGAILVPSPERAREAHRSRPPRRRRLAVVSPRRVSCLCVGRREACEVAWGLA